MSKNYCSVITKVEHIAPKSPEQPHSTSAFSSPNSSPLSPQYSPLGNPQGSYSFSPNVSPLSPQYSPPSTPQGSFPPSPYTPPGSPPITMVPHTPPGTPPSASTRRVTGSPPASSRLLSYNPGSSFEKAKMSPQSSRSESPEPNCAICLGKLENKSFTESCLHTFCFKCLLEWSKVKPECPLCKQVFKSIIHNVRSMDDYEEYKVTRPPPAPELNLRELDHLFSYRTTLTFQRILERERDMNRGYIPTIEYIPPIRVPDINRIRGSRQELGNFRRRVYNQNLWAQPLLDVTGRERDCSPEFLRSNPGQTHRLVPWLNRELGAVLDNPSRVAVVIDLILNLIVTHPIRSAVFRTQMELYLRHHTDHFIHEFYVFATTPYDLMGYDEMVTYYPHTRNESFVPEIETSSSDSDVVYVTTEISRSRQHNSASSSRRASRDVFNSSPEPGPSSSRSRTSNETERACIFEEARPGPSHRAVAGPSGETNSDSDECVVIDVVKPRHLRTPEMVVLSSDPETIEEAPTVEVENDDLPDSRDSHGVRSSYISSRVSTLSSKLSSFSTSSSEFDNGSDSDYCPNSQKQKSKQLVTKSRTNKNLQKRTSKTQSRKSRKHLSRRDYGSSNSRGSSCSSLSSLSTSSSRSTSPCSYFSTMRSWQKRTQVKSKNSSRKSEYQWCIKKRESSEESSYGSQIFNMDGMKPPYSSQELAITFGQSRRPKLRSIIIARSPNSQPSTSCSMQGSSSSFRRSHQRAAFKHKKQKHSDRRKCSSSSSYKKRSKNSSSDEPVTVRKEKKKRRNYVESSSSS